MPAGWRSTRWPTGAQAGALALALLTAMGAAHAQVSVSAGGQASYGQAISVPPGIAGMVPNLALSYADGGINGPVGVGWSVQGISTITRCPATRVSDGAARTVMFDDQDKLCLDGQRLIQTDADGTVLAQVDDAKGLTSGVREFRTEKDSFVRVRAYGMAGADASFGPAYFKVWNKSGQVYEYGTNINGNANSLVMARRAATDTAANVVAVWAVSRISDTVGNYIDFKYSQRDVAWGSGPSAGVVAGHEWNILEIQYTGTATGVPANKVIFEYVDRDGAAAPRHDRAEAYQLANKNVSIQRLDKIRTYVNAASVALGVPSGAVPVQVLKFAYGRSAQSGKSRLTSITPCAGANEARCLPATSFSYVDSGSPDFARNAAFGSSALTTLPMIDATANAYGVSTGDFNGDGRTDILRWSHVPADNRLYFSTGGGNFVQQTANFNLTAEQLFSGSSCHYAMVADFNGDGLSDILRVAKAGCTPSANVLFLSNGDGSFSSVTLPTAIELVQKKAVTSVTSTGCIIPYSEPPAPQSNAAASDQPALVRDDFGPKSTGDAGASASRQASQQVPALAGRFADRLRAGQIGALEGCFQYSRIAGQSFYLIDVDGDGLLDIVTTRAPAYSVNSGQGGVPTDDELCTAAPTPCTRVFKGSSSGAFEEVSTANARNSLHSDPAQAQAPSQPYWRMPSQADINGDGMQDILSSTNGRWRSLGNGSFVRGVATDTSALCAEVIDFNGDQRADCLRVDSNAANQSLTVSYGASPSAAIAQFNLTSAGDNLYADNGAGMQTVGVIVGDYDGDGRQDLLRWGQSNTDNGIYFSAGDGSFRARMGAGLELITRPLQGADGKTGVITGDFLGNGTLQLLHVKHAPTTPGDVPGTNQLYQPGHGGAPTDVLASVTSGTGLVSTVGPRVPLTNAAGRYLTERGTSQQGTGKVIDLQPPMFVITSLTQQTGAGSVTTEYLYKGLKAERDGRGLLGFRETRQQSPAPDGSPLTVATEYLQQHPYIGVAAVSRTYLGGLDLAGAQLLSQATYSYCDKTSAAAPLDIDSSPPAPCATSAKIQRPYLHQSKEEGWDLANPNEKLPVVTTTNTYNASLDPLTITVLSTGSSSAAGAQVFTRTSTNTYFPDQTSGDQWILGRLQTSRVRNQVPDDLGKIMTGVGDSPNGNVQNGSGAPPAPAALPPAVLSVILQLLLED